MRSQDPQQVSIVVALFLAAACVDLPIALYEVSCTNHHTHSIGCLVVIHMVLKLLASAALLAHLLVRRGGNPRLAGLELTLSWASLAIFCVLFTLGAIVRLFSDTALDSDPGPAGLLDWYQGSSQHISFVTLAVMLCPILFGSLFYDQLRGVVWAIWALCLSSLIASAAITKSTAMGFSVVYYFLISGLILVNRHQSSQVTASRQQRDERMQAQQMVAVDQNMRAMVGNVAHDLKTPLSSFMAGLDIISALTSEGMRHLRNGQMEEAFLRDMLDTTVQCVKNIHNTNAFMLMTINRCLDYTKAAQGLKLKPRPETIDLLETLSMPLNCMKDIQNRMVVRLDPMDQEICSHVITDKQWLQENVLCLLSNAVKYSAGGEVVVRVVLDEDIELATNSEDFPNHAADNKSPQRHSLRTVMPQPAEMSFSIHTTRVRGHIGDDNRSGKSGVTQVHAASHKGIRDMTETSVLLVEVEDTGIGLSNEAMAALFSPFQQSQSLAGGTGLGLFSLAKRVEALHGKCGVKRRRDGKQGSLFWFTLPYKPDRFAVALKSAMVSKQNSIAKPASMDSNAGDRSLALTAAAVAATVRVGGESASAAGDCKPQEPAGCRVLLVDDSPTISKMMSMLLRRQGFVVSTAENGAQALDLVQKALQAQSADREKVPVFDIILTDLQMPVMDGLEATKRLREMEKQLFSAATSRLHHVVIGVSANSDQDIVQQTADCGFDGFLSKPFSMSAFQDLLEDMGLAHLDMTRHGLKAIEPRTTERTAF